jgi:hypothetical protein
MKDPVDPPDSKDLLLGMSSDARGLDNVDLGPGQDSGLSGSGCSKDQDVSGDSVVSDVRADALTSSQAALAALSARRRKRMARNLPEVSEERVRELAAEYEGRDPGQNAVVMKYQRESPPLRPEARALLDQLQRIDRPAEPGIYYLWDKGRIVFVGSSRGGLVGATVSANTPSNPRYGSIVKEFDAISFQPCPETMLDIAVGAIARWLRPKYNRGTRAMRPGDQAVLDMLGFGVRAA